MQGGIYLQNIGAINSIKNKGRNRSNTLYFNKNKTSNTI